MLHKEGHSKRHVKHIELPAGYNLLSDEMQKLKVTGGASMAGSQEDGSGSFSIPKEGLPESVAFNLLQNELTLDGNPHLNLASFVNTTTTETAQRLIAANINKNLADNDEYPQMIELSQRCISMLARLWKCGPEHTALGCPTTGSSEAIMLGGLAMKRQWEKKMREAGKSTAKPNIIMSSAAQVALEKFARYFDVECRLVPVSSKSHHRLDPLELWNFADENTIGVFVILGTTYTGHLENVEEVSDVLDQIENQHPDWSNKNIPIHVDGASGGFVVPFAFTEEQMRRFKLARWGFDHPRVVSINTSGHKFGLTTPGLGWVLWKDDNYLLPELRFKLKYLGSIEETFNLNFSRPGFQVIHQYYNFLTLGKKGYRDEFNGALVVARLFCLELLQNVQLKDMFEVVSSIHERFDGGRITLDTIVREPEAFKPGVPLVAFKLSKKFQERYPEIPQALLSSLLRANGWIIPNYPLPASSDGSDKWEVLRIVFRSEMSVDLANLLLNHLQQVMHRLTRCYEALPAQLQEKGRAREDMVRNMLLTLATHDEDEETGGEHKKNYRGTC
ncbi:LAMI_0E08680g1_1 [Lachancea mirantina]|uniref:Glutamate decarboxylase n=1 Tax=Lachancea mirantina TaxID=1230905 RepID=A0A1G4JN94_9SACH|nr:LAMI_0E08680g1_1 [Lachancea mirantina]